MSGRSRELTALGLFALAVVCALGLFGDRAGPLGRFLDTALALGLGVFRYVAPLLLIWIGIAMVSPMAAERSGRVAVGLGLLTAAFAGMAHLQGSAEGFGPSTDALRSSGGSVGSRGRRAPAPSGGRHGDMGRAGASGGAGRDDRWQYRPGAVAAMARERPCGALASIDRLGVEGCEEPAAHWRRSRAARIQFRSVRTGRAHEWGTEPRTRHRRAGGAFISRTSACARRGGLGGKKIAC